MILKSGRLMISCERKAESGDVSAVRIISETIQPFLPPDDVAGLNSSRLPESTRKKVPCLEYMQVRSLIGQPPEGENGIIDEHTGAGLRDAMGLEGFLDLNGPLQIGGATLIILSQLPDQAALHEVKDGVRPVWDHSQILVRRLEITAMEMVKGRVKRNCRATCAQ